MRRRGCQPQLYLLWSLVRRSQAAHVFLTTWENNGEGDDTQPPRASAPLFLPNSVPFRNGPREEAQLGPTVFSFCPQNMLCWTWKHPLSGQGRTAAFGFPTGVLWSSSSHLPLEYMAGFYTRATFTKTLFQ